MCVKVWRQHLLASELVNSAGSVGSRFHWRRADLVVPRSLLPPIMRVRSEVANHISWAEDSHQEPIGVAVRAL